MTDAGSTGRVIVPNGGPVSRHKLWLWCVFVLGLGASIAGCAGEEGPGRQDVVGRYTASRWTVVEDSSVANALAHGGAVDLMLEDDGSTSGTALLPPEFTSSDTLLEPSLEGTWTFRNDSVHLSDLAGRVFLDSASLVVRRAPLRLRGQYYGLAVTLEPATEDAR